MNNITDAELAEIEALRELMRRVRREAFEEAASHCEESEVLMPVPEPGCTLRKHGGNVALALAAELRAKGGE